MFALDYTSGATLFMVDDIVTGQTSLALAQVLRVDGTASAGVIYVRVDEGSTVTEFLAGEVLLVNGAPYASISTITGLYVQNTINVGHDNPLNGQNISNLGSAHVRYSEGDQQLDVFGVTKTGNSSLVDQLVFSIDTNNTRFYDAFTSGSGVSFLSNSNSIALDVGSSAGEYCTRTTHIHYPYHPGYGSLSEMSVMCGDSGKDGVIRRWGRYNDDDGVYFEQSGSAISVCIRTSTGGSVQVTKVSQSVWNTDRLTGDGGAHNPSTLSLNLDKMNLFWIDYAWLGTGTVRFGYFGADGARHVVHKALNQGVNVAPYMKTGNLPFRCEISNSQATASPSRLILTCVSIKTDGDTVTPDSKFGKQFTYVTPTTSSVSSVDWTPLVTFRSTPTLGTSGIVNRAITFPGGVAGYTDHPIVLQLFQLATIDSGSWDTSYGEYYGAGLEFATGVTEVVSGVPLNSWFANASSSFEYKLTEHARINTATSTRSDGAAGDIYVIAAQSLAFGVSASVRTRLTWTDTE